MDGQDDKLMIGSACRSLHSREDCSQQKFNRISSTDRLTSSTSERSSDDNTAISSDAFPRVRMIEDDTAQLISRHADATLVCAYEMDTLNTPTSKHDDQCLGHVPAEVDIAGCAIAGRQAACSQPTRPTGKRVARTTAAIGRNEAKELEPHGPSNTQQPRKSASPYCWFSCLRLNEWWAFELAAWFSSLFILLVLVILLKIYDGRSVPKWPISLTINSVVALCSLILKATVLVPVAECISQLKWEWYVQGPSKGLDAVEAFDQASRGPWGSISFLASRRCLNLASLGALVTILTILLEPFLQQVVTYPLQSIQAGPQATAEIHKVRQYLKTGPMQANDTSPSKVISSKFSFNVDLQMKSAIYGGLYSNILQVTPSCSTGNCTWPSFSTLAICNRCEDISSMIEPIIEPKQSPVFKLPNQLKVGEICIHDGSAPNPWVNLGVASVAVQDLEGLEILDMTIMSVQRAYQCSLSWCVKRHQSNMEGGKLREDTLQSWGPNALYYQQDHETARSVDTLMHLDHIDCSLSTTDQLRAGLFLTGDGGCSRTAGCCWIHITADGEAYHLNKITHVALQDHLAGLFTGNISVLNVGTDTNGLNGMLAVKYSFPTMQALMVPPTGTAAEIAGNMSLVDIPKVMEGIADSMSAQLRMAMDGSDNSTIYGTAFRAEAMVHVQFKWLALPIVLIVSTFVFLVASMAVTARSELKAWKSSSNALLFHGLAPEKQTQENRLDRREEMDRYAKEMKVRLVQRACGWKLE